MKKIICFILVLLMVVPTVISCNNTSDTTDANTSDTAESQNVDTEPEITVDVDETVKYNTMDLSKFSVVFTDSAGADYTATFKDMIKTRTKVDLKQKRSSLDSSTYEFLIGETGREVSNDYFANMNENAGKYGYVVDGGHIFFAGADPYTIEKSFNLFVEKYVKDGKEIVVEDKITVLVDVNYEEMLLPPAAKDDELRLVSHNIILMRLSYGQRMERLYQIQTLYSLLDPDVVCLQECDEPWFLSWNFDDVLGDIGYKFVPVSDPNHSNRIAYNPETVTLLESASKELEDNYDSENRTYAWARFKDNKSGKEFIAISTHFTAGDPQAGVAQAKTLLNEMSELDKKYGLPMFSCGDYNNSVSSQAYSIMKARYNTAREKAKDKVNMAYSTVNEAGAMGGIAVKGGAIDHVFYSRSGMTGKRFETIISYYGYIASDHLPIMFDFSLT